ncbi:MAG: hypothetical protein AUK47_14660 [Deltaproteobacteria bacterium CG2_30_63_29]|nr:MAG: hypothetical protein AUK47_14660 [Deltaproteobacteria bacterium CG2_30_63_29]PJB37228.1 MAG: hypothetical protein CO108_21575 [Deltaproteobacteria bacterium CG_4_9_14_3_um_filter_63_12]
MASLIIQIKDRVVQTYPITKVDTTLGRAAGNDVVINNMSVSDFHASLRFEDPNFYVYDRGSTNGIFVDGCHVLQAPVMYGDTFGIGKFNILLTPEGGAPVEALEEGLPGTVSEPGQPHSTFFMKPVDVASLMEAKKALGVAEKPALGIGVAALVVLFLAVVAFAVLMILMLTTWGR